MKRIFKHFVINTFVLYLVSLFVEGLHFENGISTVIMAGIGLTIAGYVAKPVINLLLLPINLVTFNLFRWISSAIALYLVTLVVRGFKISNFVYGGFSNQWFSIPSLDVGGALAIIAFSFLISILSSFIYWLMK